MSNYYDRYEQLHAEGPFISQQHYMGRTIYVIGQKEAKQILGDHKRFVKDFQNTLPPEQRTPKVQSNDLFSLLYDTMLSTDAPDHTRLRALISKAFTNRQVQAMAPRIQQIADKLIDDFEAKGSGDLLDLYAFPLPIIVICELLGIPAKDRDKFRVWSHAFLGISMNDHTYVESLMAFVQYIGRTIQYRRNHPEDDLISRLVHAEDNGERLSEQELFSMIALLIVAGHETTVNLIGNGMAALLEHTDQLAILKNRPELIDSAIEEFLRYAGPVEFTTERYAAEDVEISGKLIKRGTPVTIILGATGRDPNEVENGSKLDITREAHQHMGFGYGVHYCVGAPLARLEAKIAFNTILNRLPNIRLAVPPISLEYNETSVVRGLKKLPVRWD